MANGNDDEIVTLLVKDRLAYTTITHRGLRYFSAQELMLEMEKGRPGVYEFTVERTEATVNVAIEVIEPPERPEPQI